MKLFLSNKKNVQPTSLPWINWLLSIKQCNKPLQLQILSTREDISEVRMVMMVIWCLCVCKSYWFYEVDLLLLVSRLCHYRLMTFFHQYCIFYYIQYTVLLRLLSINQSFFFFDSCPSIGCGWRYKTSVSGVVILIGLVVQLWVSERNLLTWGWVKISFRCVVFFFRYRNVKYTATSLRVGIVGGNVCIGPPVKKLQCLKCAKNATYLAWIQSFLRYIRGIVPLHFIDGSWLITIPS